MRGDPGNLVEHHIKYKELHGVDETVWLTDSEHKKLHCRLRKEGECNVPVEELAKISMAAHDRTDKRIKSRLKYNQKNRQFIEFNETFGPNTAFNERIVCNRITGNVAYYARFRGRHGKTLPMMDVV